MSSMESDERDSGLMKPEEEARTSGYGRGRRRRPDYARVAARSTGRAMGRYVGSRLGSCVSSSFGRAIGGILGSIGGAILADRLTDDDD
ncbi:MAG: hypothetical protein IJ523_04200 [Succinivibrionaceae bacterium]|nr:hypothetical protein [Succinivibrionaceae bacterium]